MSILSKEIALVLVFKIILLSLLWYLCFSEPKTDRAEVRKAFSNHVYGVSNHVSY